jgi:hypothetical protein
MAVLDAYTDEAAHAFQDEGAQLYRFEAAQRSETKPPTVPI